MEENDIITEQIKDEIKKIKLEIIEKENILDELLEKINDEKV